MNTGPHPVEAYGLGRCRSMLVELTAGYYETSAAELGWSVCLGPQPALASRRLALPPFQAELRLLGASHQIAVWLGDVGEASPVCVEPVCVETVACLPEHTDPLPRTAERELRGWRYTIESDVRTCSPAEFGLRVAGIERCAGQGLAGRYPGLPGALTAIVIRPWRAGLWWTTWHTYPQDHQIATTLSFLRIE
jgi:hypothetical protein